MPTILIVEDDRALAHMICDVLDEYGYEVVVAGDGLKALEILKNLQPDMILCDEMMPNLAGHTLCGILNAHEQYSSIPVVLMSARHIQTIPAPDTCLMFMRKPFTHDDLLNTISDVLGYTPPLYPN
ncbi:MAG TPA: response regulator [Herpetosiphonaceae bacterium]|nr:response regulator [Herpetosiphonaceae bacterium]